MSPVLRALLTVLLCWGVGTSPTHRDYCVIGAGPAGLQIGYFLNKSQRNYIIFEKSNIAGSFFTKYPIHRKLISINKIYTGRENAEYNLRHDWNSLLSDEERMLFKHFSRQMFPPADTMVTVAIVATGVWKPRVPDIPGQELMDGYESLSSNASDYEGKSVMILGRGNSAFETASAIYDKTNFVHMVGRHRIRLAWETHYVGDLRAVNNELLDTYQLKSQDGLLEYDINDYKVVKEGGKLYLRENLPDEQWEEYDNDPLLTPYDKIIRCLGFQFDPFIFRKISDVAVRPSQKYPIIDYDYRSSVVDGLYFTGTIAHSLDFRQSAGGFIHGFRYSARVLSKILNWRYHQEMWPSAILPLHNLSSVIIRRVNEASGLYQMFTYLCDIILVDENEMKYEYVEEYPTKLIHKFREVTGIDPANRKVLVVLLQYGEGFHGPEEDVFREDRAANDPRFADHSNFLHPVIYYFEEIPKEEDIKRRKRGDPLPPADKIHHILEDFSANWDRPNAHVKPLAVFLRRTLKERTQLASKYEPNEQKTFRCVDGAGQIPYEHLNDDYCDCADGSDEPGTSACTNGKFHCTNAGYIPKNIQSSRVNDGVCDCCDGSDEYGGKIECVNNCKELGKKLREEQDQKKLLQEEGFKKREGFIAEANKVMEEKRLKIQELEKEKAELQDKVKELEAKKIEVETPEKEAKDRHEQAWKEQKEAKEKERDAVKARDAFDDLDLNKDGFVDILEIIPHQEFDIDANGVVSEEEAKEHLEDQEKVDYEEFNSKIWSNIHGIYKKLVPEEEKKDSALPVESQGETGAPVPTEEPQATPHVTPPPDEGDDYEEDDEDEDEETSELETTTSMENLELETTEELFPPEVKEESVDDDKMPEYDEETKALIAAADEARKNYEEADKRSRDIDGEITTLTSYLNTDYGKDKEYAVLRDNCYEYTDREYTYKLCPFSTASQRPKSGGHETNLGRWGRWDDDQYKTQLYDHGQNCWNGPDRSVKIHISCGPEHQLTNAYEPSRCEYAFDFLTPCACNQPPTPHDKDTHDEL
ncbi:uncharacterized protein LOC125669743 isoform X3 [Ostrea edulis]|uniref:uncharacterized protein LOC125669743 isoform X3 n=1 Tax=Ostrea edulis TaxID=37623 RepID=UPI0024AFAB7D|nr:uncharacterized protein LOC125669743 isoform X3 [Ostrea edulis]